ncbi:MAG: hypothetical protein QOD39_2337, partial [Mycobacterium sp.]|nr:hypothetical protein [Mycobacterium sp.]
RKAGDIPQRSVSSTSSCTLGEAARSWELYLKYGLPLVAACAAAGTDYADLTGEGIFIRESIDLYHKQAIDTGARIVHSCGFDSIPSDLTVFALYRQLEQDNSGQFMDTSMVVRSLVAAVSGGHRRLGNGADACHLGRPRGQAVDERPLHIDTRSRRRTRTRRSAGLALASRRGHHARAQGLLGRAIRDGRRQHANCPSQQCITRIRLRQAVRVRGADERVIPMHHLLRPRQAQEPTP